MPQREIYTQRYLAGYKRKLVTVLKTQPLYIKSAWFTDVWLNSEPEFCINVGYNAKKMLLGKMLKRVCVPYTWDTRGCTRVYRNPYYGGNRK